VAVAPSVEQIAALIGVLKAGAAFLPLDVERPASYRAAVCAAARPAAVVVRGEPAPGLSGHTIIDLAALPACADVQLPDDVTGDDAAYVIFTSGSSGEPKGVLVQHRAIVNHTAWMQETWPLNGSDAVLHRTSIGFDASIWEVFSPLAAGARLIVADADTRRDIQALLQLISDASVTVMQAVPSLLAALVREPAFGACPTVRRIFAGGEQLSRELVDRLLARSAAEVVNLYGPTEATIDATTWTCRRDDARAVIPIGRPIANVRVHVLDAHGAPVPIGVVGELYLGGTALACGYWQRPAMTAERFVPDHLGEVPGQRLYRTGDLVRLRIDGALELVGRADDQIKIRGHRVELGEVEAGLRALDGVDDAAVVVAGNGADVRLVAFVTGPAAAAASALRDALRVRLLEAMVPAVVLGLDALPVTGSGKIDRRALLAQVPPLTAGATARRPHTALERRIADVWSEVMERRLDDVEANFFELGGNSLLAMQVISRLRSQLGYTVTLRTLFEAPTVAALATRVGRDIDGRELTATPVSPAVDRSGIEAVVARVVAGAVGDPAIEVTGVIPETTWAGRVASQISATLARYFELPALVTPPAPTVTELAAEILVALAQRGGRSVTAQLEGWLTELEDIR
jgi:amino acid adenylation domain-containing protein